MINHSAFATCYECSISSYHRFVVSWPAKSVLKLLHSLPVEQRILYKLCTVIHIGGVSIISWPTASLQFLQLAADRVQLIQWTKSCWEEPSSEVTVPDYWMPIRPASLNTWPVFHEPCQPSPRHPAFQPQLSQSPQSVAAAAPGVSLMQFEHWRWTARSVKWTNKITHVCGDDVLCKLIFYITLHQSKLKTSVPISVLTAIIQYPGLAQTLSFLPPLVLEKRVTVRHSGDA